jgi:hypothetical protein
MANKFDERKFPITLPFANKGCNLTQHRLLMSLSYPSGLHLVVRLATTREKGRLWFRPRLVFLFDAK